MGQFLGPETDIMGERYFMTLWQTLLKKCLIYLMPPSEGFIFNAFSLYTYIWHLQVVETENIQCCFKQIFAGNHAVAQGVVRPEESQVYEIWQEPTSIKRKTKKFSIFPSLKKKWGVFQNVFGNSQTYNRQRSSFGKLYLCQCETFCFCVSNFTNCKAQSQLKP